MPFFSQAPSSSLAASLRRAVGGSGGQLDPMQEIQIDGLAAKTAHDLKATEKLALDIKERLQAAAYRDDPAKQAEFASNASRLDLPTGRRLLGSMRGELEQPGPADIDDANAAGVEAQPYQMGRPNVTQAVAGRFQDALAALNAERFGEGKSNAENMIKAVGEGQRNNVLARAAEAAARGDIAGVNLNSSGVLHGKELTPFKTNEAGITTNEWNGKRDETSPLFMSKLDELKAKIGQANAAAGASGAHAGLFRAQTDKTRSDMTREEKGQYDSARGILVDPRTAVAREVVDALGKPIGTKDKPLPNPAIEKLSAAGTAVEDTTRLAGTFKPEYGGKTILGDLSNTYKRIAGDETGQAQWWQDMDNLQNQTRHALFGSALTATELAAWNKTSIQPRMNAKQIQENLTRRQEIEARAASKLSRAYEAGGYNKQQIEELLGVGAAYLQNPAPPVGSKGASGGWDGKDRRAAGGKPTQADLEYTAKKNGMTVEQVKAQLGIE